MVIEDGAGQGCLSKVIESDGRYHKYEAEEPRLEAPLYFAHIPMKCVTIIPKSELSLGDESLPYYVRLMSKEDIAQVDGIDREAFPTQWPAANYRHELQNRLAHYIVACDEERMVEKSEVKTSPEKGFLGLASRVRQLFNHNRFFSNELPPSGTEYIVGFTGFWIMADEAHVTNIAVRELHRRQGIGELLLISSIDLATELNARIITLEVRASNTAAQNLYHKYGFTQTGVRRGYYTDNKEDAVLMSTENITSASFQTHLRQLKQAHSRKWGIALYQIAR